MDNVKSSFPDHSAYGGVLAGQDAALPVQGGRGGRVAVVGLGYVGVPTALALVAAGYSVVGVDVSHDRLAGIRAGRVDLPAGRRERLTAALRNGCLHLTADPRAVRDAQAVVLCVPTPVDAHQVPDLRALVAACSSAVAHAVRGQLLVLTSTSYVGTTRDLLVKPLAARGMAVDSDVFVAFAPERIDPGNQEHVPEGTPRVVGGAGARSTDRAVALLAATASRVHRVDSLEVAEMSKLWENAFRAVNIALANELADASVELGLDPWQVIDAAATKPYGFMPFYPGPGVGGHCIPCDPHYLLWQMRVRHTPAPLVDAAMSAIAQRPLSVVRGARDLLADAGRAVTGARILLVGVAYKPGVGDVRQSPALEIIDRLTELGAEVDYTDPLVPVLTCATTVRRSVVDPASRGWDLVVVHTRQPGVDLAWLDHGLAAVLDTSHRGAARAAAVTEPVG